MFGIGKREGLALSFLDEVLWAAVKRAGIGQRMNNPRARAAGGKRGLHLILIPDPLILHRDP